MLKVILFLETLVKKPIFVLKKDIQTVLQTEIGSTKLLLSDSNSIFIDDIIEESLIINEQKQENYLIHRIFVQAVDCYNDYCHVGWILNEDMPVCILCRIEFTPFDTKQHCKACGNICCQSCSGNVTTIIGLESLGGLRVCNLCFYGQEKVDIITYRQANRFEIKNQGDLEKGLTDVIRVLDTNNKQNAYHLKNNTIRSIIPSITESSPSLRTEAMTRSEGSFKKQSSDSLKQHLRENATKRGSKIFTGPIGLDEILAENNSISSTTHSSNAREVETLLSITAPSQDNIELSGKQVNLSHSPVLPKTKDEILVNLKAPPKLMGWLKKRGHLIQNWKTRYFVLDNGFLTYYLDKLDIPPYGKGVKGQICLAGYRERKESFQEQVTSPFQTNNPQHRSDDNSDRDSSRTTANIIHVDYTKNNMIHLDYTPGIVKEDVILYLKQSNSRTPDHSSGKGEDQYQQSYELILETATMEEKVAWCTTLQQHIEYIEMISQNIKNINHEGRMISDDFTHYKSLEFQSDPSPHQSSVKGKRNSATRAGGGGGGGNNHSDSDDFASSKSSSLANRPLSLRQSVVHSQKYHIFIYADEVMIFSGLIGKPNKLSVQKIRELVFVKTKPLTIALGGGIGNGSGTHSLPFQTKSSSRSNSDRETSPSPASSSPNGSPTNPTTPRSPSSPPGNQERRCLKRLLYIDSSKYELKGDIRWIEHEPPPIIKQVGEKYFEVYDKRLNKNYYFYPKDDATVSQWIEILNNH